MPKDTLRQYDTQCITCMNVKPRSVMVWDSNFEKEVEKQQLDFCGVCKSKTEHLIIIPEIKEDLHLQIGKLSKEEIVRDRKQRSREHFKREIIPTIGSKKDKKYFLNKHGWKS